MAIKFSLTIVIIDRFRRSVSLVRSVLTILLSLAFLKRSLNPYRLVGHCSQHDFSCAVSRLLRAEGDTPDV